ncbi:SDR family oxidoreductase [Acinetobacter sp. B51(2017)]|uniref:SDR family oxidoreductase n=1 Tax=Acinetobacter sp. B51(2017) TaxID=2060938 RepID=UPI000F091447|nr:SDR family oxidoreductase [Acinetobacter sp. B51(2017)]
MKTILITGAAQGMGAAIALQLLQQGHMVIGLDCQDQPENWEIEQQLTPVLRSRWLGITQDIRDYATTQQLVAELLLQYDVDALVNAAGILRMTRLLEASTEDWQDSFAVNVLAPIHLSQQCATFFCEKKQGNIVTISSNSARMPRLDLGLYATTKAALSHFCRNLALEVAPFGVRVNVISPGSTVTAMQKQLWSTSEAPSSILTGDLSQFRTGIPLGKMAQADDIAHAVCFFLSEQAAQITMQELVIDGGATLGV